MKANDLRIGNWVSNGEKYFTVDANFLYDMEAAETPALFCIPILLTPGILEKAGFTCNDYACYIHTSEYGYIAMRRETGMISFSLDPQDDLQMEISLELPHIKFLHQIQNLYQSHTQTELTISL